MKALVLEDQKLIRDYLVKILQEDCGFEKITALGAMRELEKSPEAEMANLVLFDIDLGDGTPLAWATDRLTRPNPPRMIAISAISASFPYKQLQKAGISLAHKNDGEETLVQLIKKTLEGATVISPNVLEIVNTIAPNPNSPLKILGPKEIKVLAGLGQRLSNDEIATIIGTTPQTVADHRKRIMRKLDLHSIEELIDCAIREGLVYDASVYNGMQKRPQT